MTFQGGRCIAFYDQAQKFLGITSVATYWSIIYDATGPLNSKGGELFPPLDRGNNKVHMRWEILMRLLLEGKTCHGPTD